MTWDFGSGPLAGWAIEVGLEPERSVRGALLQLVRLSIAGDEPGMRRLLEWRAPSGHALADEICLALQGLRQDADALSEAGYTWIHVETPAPWEGVSMIGAAIDEAIPDHRPIDVWQDRDAAGSNRVVAVGANGYVRAWVQHPKARLRWREVSAELEPGDVPGPNTPPIEWTGGQAAADLLPPAPDEHDEPTEGRDGRDRAAAPPAVADPQHPESPTSPPAEPRPQPTRVLEPSTGRPIPATSPDELALAHAVAALRQRREALLDAQALADAEARAELRAALAREREALDPPTPPAEQPAGAPPRQAPGGGSAEEQPGAELETPPRAEPPESCWAEYLRSVPEVPPDAAMCASCMVGFAPGDTALHRTPEGGTYTHWAHDPCARQEAQRTEEERALDPREREGALELAEEFASFQPEPTKARKKKGGYDAQCELCLRPIRPGQLQHRRSKSSRKRAHASCVTTVLQQAERANG